MWLEKELLRVQERYENELNIVRSSFQKQLDDAITVNQNLRDELQRTRILLSPGLQAVHLPQEHDESTPPKDLFEIPTGTSWQRTLARETKEEWERGRKATAEAAARAAAKGDS